MRAWLAEQFRTYFQNAGSVRDLRSNMRGWNTPVTLFCYLGFLTLLACLFYLGATREGSRSVTEVQGALNAFSLTVLGTTSLLVGLIAPSLVCTSIVGEYQRKSIDLVFSAPVTTKYFLVGKLLSSYRYIALLAFMTLPVLALGVVLGGATPDWVFKSLFLCTMHGLLFCAVSLPIATVSGRVVPAVGYSLAACIAVAVQPVVLQVPTMGLTGGQPSFLSAMTPFMLFPAVDSATPLLGVPWPNWVLGSLAILLLVRVFVVGAGSALSQAGSADTVSLRLHCLALAALVCTGVRLAMSGTSLPLSTAGASPTASLVFGFSAYLVVALPFVAVWSSCGDAKTYPNGWFNPRLLLRGTPASGLPFLLALMLVVTSCLGIPAWAADPRGLAADAPYVFATWSLLLLGWAFGWFASLVGGGGGPAGSRRILFALLAGLVILPFAVLGWVASLTSDPDVMVRFNPLLIPPSTPAQAWAKGGAMLVVAVFVGVLAEMGRRSQESARRQAYAGA